MKRLVVLLLALAGCAPSVGNEEPIQQVQQDVTPPTKAYCSITVTGKGTKNMEEDYLPHVITCENGGANLQALKAQAIAARSVAYYAIKTSGGICDGQGCQVYSCGATPSAKAKQAVKETAGQFLKYDGMLTYGFYVSGDPNSSAPSCKGSSSHPMEKYVTYNLGLSGTSVKQTSLGYIGPPGYGQNRGCMSQWGARCLENSKGQDYKQILQFYYGKDIGIAQATGSCVAPTDTDGDGVSDDKDNCKTVDNAGQTDTDGDAKGDACDDDDDADGVKDAVDNCAKVKNAGQKDSDTDGKGDACDGDDDADGVADETDVCPSAADADQLDTDGDGEGDACDGDDDDDDVTDPEDNCALDANSDQDDSDDDGIGDACDDTDDTPPTGTGGGSAGSSGSGGKTGSGGSGQTTTMVPNDEGGCSASSRGSSTSGAIALLVLAGLVFRRRRCDAA
jgi:MYXO-CTERM domain-containing protein